MERRKARVYMDDRTRVDKTAKGMIPGIRTWQQWSGEVGLKENPTNVQMSGRSNQQREKLKAAAGKELKEFIKKKHRSPRTDDSRKKA